MSIRQYDQKHFENVLAYMRQTQRMFFRSADRISRLYESLPMGTVFDIESMPGIRSAIDQELRRLANEIADGVVNGINNEWTLSNNKNDEMVNALTRGRPIPEPLREGWMGRNLSALEAFRKRTEAGLGLSDRIWQTVRGHATNIERHLALGIHEGTPARELASQMKQYLNNPDALFRRVRDIEGELKLSRAAREYKPGAGRYRSAYKNALRLTRTETNKAYQQADNERWDKQDFVLGVEVQRSNVPYDCDICAAGVGRYPKDYEWTLWHPACRCRAIPILASEEEVAAQMQAVLRGENYQYTGYVQDIPDSMKDFKQKTGYEHFGHD